MKAVVKYGNNPGELEVRDVMKPELGPDDILVKVEACGICGSDLLFYQSIPLNVPTILGHEFAGTVAEVGKNVTRWKIGERIVSDNTGYACGECHSCATGQFLECEHRIAIGYGFDGGFAEYVKIPGQILKLNPNTVFHIPDSVSYEAASMLDPCANAYQALVQKSSFCTGDDVVIYGPGTIGLLCVQVAKASGANRIVVMGTEKDIERNFVIAKQLGATHTVVSTQPKAIDEVLNILGNKPRIIIDCAGSPAVLKQGLDMLANGGDFVKIGFDHQPLNIDFNTVVLKGIRIIGNMGYNYISWKNSIALIESGKIDVTPIITHRLSLDNYEEGFQLLFNKQAIKVILKP